MIKTIRTWVRPNTATPWWTSIIAADYRPYVKDNFSSQGKMSQTLVTSKDGLELTSETIYRDEEAFKEVTTDPIVSSWYKTRAQYCVKNGITESPLIITQE